ncbi:hypothetical protein [Paenibacillus sp. MMS20-IR301]|uniref:hypothetical protein n=1 Tax=Paenibacillus sp. MMS20-IR301 TaxID=2895946 RepID=UPI0028F141E4|nr:hypothetical protein [Paenibacillus sp. MMS20-IR301]WNS45885.1 hypothetical protein LOS79_11625 [Paenibacillus sp. MMS20-IR301]
MEVVHGQPEQIKFGIFSGKEFRGLLTEFPNKQIVAVIVVSDRKGTREYRWEITASREEALTKITAWWSELENNGYNVDSDIL